MSFNNNLDFFHRAFVDNLQEVVTINNESLFYFPFGQCCRPPEKKNTIICALWLNSQCSRENCFFSHDPSSIYPTPVPKNFKSEKCKKEEIDKDGTVVKECRYNYHCNFAHSNEKVIKKGNLVFVQVLRGEEWVTCRVGQIDENIRRRSF